MYLLDTDTIIYSLKGNETVQSHLKLYLNDPIKISVITLMGLYYRAKKSKKISVNLAKIKTIEQYFEIIPVGVEIVEIFEMLKAQLEKKGDRLDDFDLIIASSALTNNLTIITNNEKHFKRIDGLKVENWTK